MKVNFITNLPLQEVSGGFSGMNVAAHEALAEIAEVHCVGPISPRTSPVGRLAAKLKRSLRTPAKFFAFSEARLQQIAEQVARQRRRDADLDFYHGFTPWIRCVSPVPYAAWSDCCFRDYLDIYHPAGSFDECDIARICSSESKWMRGSRSALLSSEWARLRTKAHYNLPDTLLGNVGIFGAMEIPAQDCHNGGRGFLFISTDFARKNGLLCCQAMQRVWREAPEATLTIIGAAPPAHLLADPRVRYEGYFDKSKPDQLAMFARHLSRAFALIHPTTADTTAMVVIEAAFYGCPSITVRDFALPEVTGNGACATLLDRPVTADTLAQAMISLIFNQRYYHDLRARARDFSIRRFSRGAFKKRLQDRVRHIISEAETKRA